jgi:hypothetical protein
LTGEGETPSSLILFGGEQADDRRAGGDEIDDRLKQQDPGYTRHFLSKIVTLL